VAGPRLRDAPGSAAGRGITANLEGSRPPVDVGLSTAAFRLLRAGTIVNIFD
jgi:hypothetical protein